MTRPYHDPIVSTHALFLLNAILYSIGGFFMLSFVLLLNTIASFLYHLSKETNTFWKKADHILCVTSLGFIFTYLILCSSSIEIMGCIVWLILSLVVYKAGRLNYEIFHTLWHGCVFLGNVAVWYCIV